jgi:hypothetical protein
MAHKHNQQSAYEDQWQKAFEEAEITPSPAVWDRIDNSLTARENGRYKRGIVFYRWVAAASVVSLLAMGYLLWSEVMSTDNDSRLTDQPAEMRLRSPQATQDKTGRSSSEGGSTEQAAAGETDELSASGKGTALAEREAAESPEKTADIASTPKATGRSYAAGTSGSAQPPATVAQQAKEPTGSSGRGITLVNPSGFNRLPLASLDLQAPSRLYRVPQQPDEKEDENEVRFFAGLNLGTNLFDPNFSPGASGNLAMAEASPMVNDYLLQANRNNFSALGQAAPARSGLQATPRLSFSYGVDVGMMISEHFSLESGLDYGRMGTATSTNWFSEDYGQGTRTPVLATNLAEAEQLEFSPRQQELSSTFDFVSLPLRLAYNLDFHRFRLSLSSGAAANFFLGNEISDESGQLNTLRLDAGEASPYRDVYYSALLGAALQYRLDENYALSLSPNYQFSLTELSSDQSGIVSQPNIFAIDLGLRFNFK